MVIGVNGAIGQNVINLVLLDFKTDQELVTTLHLNMEEIIALAMLRISNCAMPMNLSYTPVDQALTFYTSTL